MTKAAKMVKPIAIPNPLAMPNKKFCHNKRLGLRTNSTYSAQLFACISRAISPIFSSIRLSCSWVCSSACFSVSAYTSHLIITPNFNLHTLTALKSLRLMFLSFEDYHRYRVQFFPDYSFSVNLELWTNYLRNVSAPEFCPGDGRKHWEKPDLPASQERALTNRQIPRNLPLSFPELG